MTEEQESQEQSHREQRLKNVVDFRDEIGSTGDSAVSAELDLPNIDKILKDLQRQYGVRITLSPNLVSRMEQLKTTRASDPGLRIGCHETDTCILCDSGDYCQTCDVSDWCWSHDTHYV